MGAALMTRLICDGTQLGDVDAKGYDMDVKGYDVDVKQAHQMEAGVLGRTIEAVRSGGKAEA